MNKFRAVAYATMIVAAMSMLFIACTKEQQQAVKSVVSLADKACVLIRHVGPSGTLQEICAYEEELSPLVPVLLSGRARHPVDAGVETAPLAGAAGPDSECMNACSAVCK